MKRYFKMTEQAKEALWSTLSNNEIFIPTQFCVNGDVEDGYTIEYLDSELCGFDLLVSGKKLRSLYAAKAVIQDINTNGKPKNYGSLVDCRSFAWSHIPIPSTTL